MAPRTETEGQLTVIWQELLGIEKIGVYDNFFELGGHSLLATRLVATIIKEFKTEILIKDIFSFVMNLIHLLMEGCKECHFQVFHETIKSWSAVCI